MISVYVSVEHSLDNFRPRWFDLYHPAHLLVLLYVAALLLGTGIMDIISYYSTLGSSDIALRTRSAGGLRLGSPRDRRFHLPDESHPQHDHMQHGDFSRGCALGPRLACF
jgi:hypothetical protein